MTFVLKEIELPLIPIIEKMEKEGIFIDVLMLEESRKLYTSKLIDIEKYIFKLAGVEFNINSPKQVGEIFI